jgi:prepilin-type N-terminal cleavage/methylation domain-containing protein
MRINRLRDGVTLIELIVVLMILSILSTIAVGVYTKEVRRAKIVKTRAEIRTLSVALHRYQIDVGQFPPSSTGTTLAPGSLDQVSPVFGNGYMQVALRGSLNGNMRDPLSPLWLGPYMEWDENRLGTPLGEPLPPGIARAQVQFLDPFGTPYQYVSSAEYELFSATLLPSTDPFFATETYYNPTSFQLYSYGPNGVTNPILGQRGTDEDDITNWRGPLF